MSRPPDPPKRYYLKKPFMYFMLAYSVSVATVAFIFFDGVERLVFGSLFSWFAGWYVNEILFTEPWRDLTDQWRKLFYDVQESYDAAIDRWNSLLNEDPEQ